VSRAAALERDGARGGARAVCGQKMRRRALIAQMRRAAPLDLAGAGGSERDPVLYFGENGEEEDK